MAKYNESQEEFKKLQLTLRHAHRRFELCRQFGGANLLPDHLPPPQPVLLDMRVAGAVDENKPSKVRVLGSCEQWLARAWHAVFV